MNVQMQILYLVIPSDVSGRRWLDLYGQLSIKVFINIIYPGSGMLGSYLVRFSYTIFVIEFYVLIGPKFVKSSLETVYTRGWYDFFWQVIPGIHDTEGEAMLSQFRSRFPFQEFSWVT